MYFKLIINKYFLYFIYIFMINKLNFFLKMGIGDWAQSPIPNPHFNSH